MGDCTGCPYAPTYEEYCNGLIDCPDAYTDKARLCNRNMTNEEETQSAIEWIEGLRDRWNDKDNVKYCNMAIKALEQEPILDKIIAEIKEWYWQADKQALAKDPCVVDAMIDLFIRTIDKYRAESEEV